MLELEPMLRLGAALGVFGVMAAWEFRAPRRDVPAHRAARWPGNLGIQLVNAILLRAVFPGAAVAIALYCEQRGVGLFALFDVPVILGAAVSLVVLDLAVYAQHVLMHRVPVLWRMHRMHHSDTHLDVTSALRFHPLEILLSMLWKGLVIAALGAPAAAVLIFEIVLNGMAMFNHGNVKMPAGVDRAVRRILVTPDMHRVHHSWLRPETDSNFGFNLALWDRVFRTYRDQPEAGHDGMTIGLDAFRELSDSRIDRLLLQPLRHDGNLQRS